MLRYYTADTPGSLSTLMILKTFQGSHLTLHPPTLFHLLAPGPIFQHPTFGRQKHTHLHMQAPADETLPHEDNPASLSLFDLNISHEALNSSPLPSEDILAGVMNLTGYNFLVYHLPLRITHPQQPSIPL
ncbi:hypothetical protein QQF64_025262 [Cirrhinus molitorella]|uniref:Uncharacterized protein n=1 Tax=Cirrhinus molitorella TaxID=172907 RepID=A0ABR3NNV2_9TELE